MDRFIGELDQVTSTPFIDKTGKPVISRTRQDHPMDGFQAGGHPFVYPPKIVIRLSEYAGWFAGCFDQIQES